MGLTQSAEDGRVFVWGYNGDGQLGLGDRQARNQPTLLNFPAKAHAIVAGPSHSFVLSGSSFHFIGLILFVCWE
jgi:alpha-tubulin suppressor-like RCC1 family protein